MPRPLPSRVPLPGTPTLRPHPTPTRPPPPAARTERPSSCSSAHPPRAGPKRRGAPWAPWHPAAAPRPLGSPAAPSQPRRTTVRAFERDGVAAKETGREKKRLFFLADPKRCPRSRIGESNIRRLGAIADAFGAAAVRRGCRRLGARLRRWRRAAGGGRRHDPAAAQLHNGAQIGTERPWLRRPCICSAPSCTPGTMRGRPAGG